MPAAIFLNLSGPDTGVFESQVLEYGAFMRRLGIDFRYVLYEGLRTALRSGRQLQRRVATLRERYDAPIELRYLLAPLTEASLRLVGRRLAHTVRSASHPPLLIQARGAVSTCAALAAKQRGGRTVVVYDARGDEEAEARLEGEHAATAAERDRWVRRAERLAVLQQRAAAGADHILAVSTPLRDFLCGLGGIEKTKTTIIPCCVTPERFAQSAAARASVRTRLQLDDKLVLIYSGSLGPYQIPDKIAALMIALKPLVPSAHLLILSRDREAAQHHFGDLFAQNAATLETSDFSHVPEYLAAADAALLLREHDGVNRVACPVKFAEYQMAGLPVILTTEIGDVSDGVVAGGHGTVIRLTDTPAEQAAAIAAAVSGRRWPSREDIRARAAKTFARSAYTDVYRATFAALGVLEAAPSRIPHERPLQYGRSGG